MMSEWKEYKLEDVCIKITDGSHFSPKKLNNGEKIIATVKDMTEYGFDLSSCKRISLEEYNLLAANDCKPLKNDILFSKDGTIGQIIVFDGKLDLVILSSIAIIRPNTEIVNPAYLGYYLKNDKSQKDIKENYRTGSVIPRVILKDFKRFPLTIPSLKVQNKIVEILSSLDDKIELNNTINKNLEELAQAIFKRWFVDFEFPCLPENYQYSGTEKPEDFESVMTYRKVGSLPMPDGKSWFVSVLICDDDSFHIETTQDLYRSFYEFYKGLFVNHTKINKPIRVIHWESFNSKAEADSRVEKLKTEDGQNWLNQQYSVLNSSILGSELLIKPAGEMVDSELGEIPKGWSIFSLNQILYTVSDTYPLKKVKDIIFLNTGDILEGRFLHDNIANPSNLPGQAKKSIKKDDILFSEIRPANKRFAFVHFNSEKYVVSTKLMVLRSNINISPLFSYFILTQEATLDQLQRLAESRSGTFPQITFAELSHVKFAAPDFDFVNLFSNLVLNQRYEHFFNSELENRYLIELRDFLLPKLISGELEVSETITEPEKAIQ